MTPLEERTMRWIFRKPWYGPIVSLVGVRHIEGDWPMRIAVLQMTWQRGAQQGTEACAAGLN